MNVQEDFPISAEVAAAFDSYPAEMRAKLLTLRQLIFETAAALESVGEIEETLKWGEPSYLTPQTKSGSTVRLAWKAKKPDQYSIFFKCTANLVVAFREKFPDQFSFGGDRSIDFKLDETVPDAALKQCIALALTYHRNKTLTPTQRWETVAHLA